jgi:23S rRNA (uracil1939-C5)-methyltransferase
LQISVSLDQHIADWPSQISRAKKMTLIEPDEILIPAMTSWQQGALLELEISDLSDQGEGVGRWQERVVFVPDTVPGDQITVRLVHVKPQYAQGKLQAILTPSPHRIRPACMVADKCGGCQWQHIDYEFQRQAKQNLVIQAIERIGGIPNPPVQPILAGDDCLHYRNKVAYPLHRSPTGQVKAGYYQKGSHHLINLNQCPIQDSQLDPFFAAGWAADWRGFVNAGFSQ